MTHCIWRKKCQTGSRLLRQENGNATVLVLLLLTLLIGVGFAYRQTMGLEGRAVAAYAARLQAAESARAGLESVLSILRSDDPSFDSLTDGWATSSFLEADLGDGARYSARASKPGGNDGVVDVESELPVQTLPESVLTRIPGLPANGANAILQARGRGTPPATFEDFLRISELNREEFGKKTNMVPRDVIALDPDVRTVNANTASVVVLRILLGNEPLAQQLLSQRQGTDKQDGTADDRPFRSDAELRSFLTSSSPAVPAESQTLGVGSTRFRVSVTGEYRSGPVYSRYRLGALILRSGHDVRILSQSEI